MTIPKTGIGRLFVAFLAIVLFVGCSNNTPVTPAESEGPPTSAEPPPGEEPTLPEEGP